MKTKAKSLTVAVLMTILDAVVTASYGPAIWQVWGMVPLFRYGILVLAGTGSFTLVHIWAHTLEALRPAVQISGASDLCSTGAGLGEEMVDADV